MGLPSFCCNPYLARLTVTVIQWLHSNYVAALQLMMSYYYYYPLPTTYYPLPTYLLPTYLHTYLPTYLPHPTYLLPTTCS
jgi:hypothetical protein